MSDPRIQTVADVLREHGHNATGTGADTDTLATAIVNALDGQHGNAEADDAGEVVTGEGDNATTTTVNPETPTGTGTEGGAGNPAQ